MDSIKQVKEKYAEQPSNAGMTEQNNCTADDMNDKYVCRNDINDVFL